jgi:DNA-binding response OmpR family regulator
MARILVVDDDGLARKGTHRLLERAGHEVWETAAARVALDLLVEMPMDLVITDIYMPGVNGFEFLRRMREQRVEIGLIATTGGGHRAADDLLSEAVGLGAEQVLVKPYLPDTLFAAVDDVLRRRAARAVN